VNTKGKTVKERTKLEAVKLRRSLLAEECESSSGFFMRTNPTNALQIKEDTASKIMAVD